MPPADRKPDDVFYCPSCNQKHRGDLSAARAGTPVRVKCAGCARPLTVEWKDDAPVVRPAEADAAKATPPAPAAKAAPPPAPAPKPEAAKAPPPVRGKGEDDAGAKRPREGARRERDEEKGPAEREPRGKDGKGKAEAEAEPPIVADFAAGTSIGRYTLEDAIGQGGTGTVYRAFDPTTNRYVALKMLGLGQSDAMRQRFLREIEVQANLRHPNLMPVFDRGEHDGRPYFTMELLYRPFTLTDIVTRARDGTLSRYTTLKPYEDLKTLVRDVLLPVCEGLQIANVENGVVHRDLKPDNVLVDSRTLRPYVIDFGICHVLEKKTRAGGVALAPTAEDAGIVGTPRFLAPEQARGTVHERTDVWGLGALLRFAATGEPPIAAASPISRAELKRRIEALRSAEDAARKAGDETKAELCADKLSRLEDDGLRTLDDLFKDARDGTYTPMGSDVPPGLAAIVRKATAPKTAERYVNARSLASDVEAWLAGRQTRAQAEEGTTAAVVVQNVGSAVRRHLTTAVVAAAVGALAFVVGRGAGGGAGGGGSGGGGEPTTRLAALEVRVDDLARNASRFTPADGARLSDLLTAELDAERSAAAGRATDTARLAALAGRLGRQRVRVEAPVAVAEVSVEDVVRGGDPVKAKPDDLWLAPGEYRLDVGSVRVPLIVPFLVRGAGEDAAREPARFTVKIPVDPASVPERMVLVVPGAETVEHRGPPWSAPVAVPARVGAFLLDRYETSNGEWADFLASLNDTERKKRVPSVEFGADPERPGHYVVARGTGSGTAARDLPVRGVSPDDALAFVAWRAEKDGGSLRLPTEAEWVVAAGWLLRHDLPGGVRGTVEDGDFSAPVPVKTARDRSPYGVLGMLGNARELVTAYGSAAEAPDHFLAKGAAAGDDPFEAATRRVRVVARDTKDEKLGLRLARDLSSR